MSALKKIKQIRRGIVQYYAVGLYNAVGEHHVFLTASGLAFSALLSALPLGMVAFSILGGMLDSGAVQDQINHYIQTLIPYPEFAATIMRFVGRRIEEFVTYKGIAGVLGVGGLLFFASGLFSSMKTALNRVYAVTAKEHLLISILWDLALTVLVIIFLLLSIFVFPAIESIQGLAIPHTVPGWRYLQYLESGLFYVFSLAVMFAIFFLLYKFVPSKASTNRLAMISAFWATLLWEIARQAFGFYVHNVATLERLYGAYLFIAVVALWIYYGALIFILSAEIGQLAVTRRKSRWQELREYLKNRNFGKK